MTNAESKILAAIAELERDDIDDLVDIQMQQTPSGYDHNVNQPTCWQCGEDRHELPIKQRMQEIRRLWHSSIHCFEDARRERRVPPEVTAELDAYRYDQDDSPVLCPGSDFIGPLADRWQIATATQWQVRHQAITEFLGSDPGYEELRGFAEHGYYTGPANYIGHFFVGLPLPENIADDESLWVSMPFGPGATPKTRGGALGFDLCALIDAQVAADFAETHRQMIDAMLAPFGGLVLAPWWQQAYDGHDSPSAVVVPVVTSEPAHGLWQMSVPTWDSDAFTSTMTGFTETFTAASAGINEAFRQMGAALQAAAPALRELAEAVDPEPQDSGHRRRSRQQPPMWTQDFSRRGRGRR